MVDIESLSASLAEDAPSGTDMEYDPVFMALEQAGAGKAEQQFGDHIVAAEDPDWRTVHEHALDLAVRTRDLRVAVWLLRSEARLHGLIGAARSLRLIHRLIEVQWATVHPQLDASDHDDPTMRLNALSALSLPEAALADLRAATLGSDRGGVSVRDLELGLGKAEALSTETVPSQSGVMQALEGALAQQPGLADEVSQALGALRATIATLDARVGTQGPDLGPMVRLLKVVDDAIGRSTGAAGAEAETADANGHASAGASAGRATSTPGTIVTREDAARMLERVCDWFDRHEPSHPAPLLIRRAHRLMSKSFMEIMRDLAPDSVDQIVKLAGTEAET